MKELQIQKNYGFINPSPRTRQKTAVYGEGYITMTNDKVHFSFKLDKNIFKEIQDIAKRRGVSISLLWRQWMQREIIRERKRDIREELLKENIIDS